MLGSRIRELREARHLSQTDLAKEFNISKQSISNWENLNVMPSVEMLVKLASYFSVSADYLLGLDDRQIIDVTGLDENSASHIRMLVDDLLSRGK